MNEIFLSSREKITLDMMFWLYLEKIISININIIKFPAGKLGIFVCCENPQLGQGF